MIIRIDLVYTDGINSDVSNTWRVQPMQRPGSRDILSKGLVLLLCRVNQRNLQQEMWCPRLPPSRRRCGYNTIAPNDLFIRWFKLEVLDQHSNYGFLRDVKSIKSETCFSDEDLLISSTENLKPL